MAKSNKKNSNQLLSPENYIRQKARNLPIFECKVNKEWDANKIAQVLVSRSHANGNITLGFYLVDLACLGVKDTFYQFNIDSQEYASLIENFDDMHMQTISYELAHNIVYAGVEFAEEFGFKPHKDFSSITRFMLDEDNDDVELIEINVGGDDGNPLYVNSGYESPAKEKQILAQLEKTAGKGNFNFVSSLDLNKSNNKISNDYNDRDLEFSEFMLNESKKEFLKLSDKNISKLSKDELIKLIELSDDIFTEICNESKLYDFIDRWDSECDLIFTKEYPNEFIGVDDNVEITDKQLNLIDDIIALSGKNDKKAKKKNLELEKEIGKTAITAVFELEILKTISINDYNTKLAEYLSIYPDCSMLKMMNQHEHIFDERNDNLIEYMPDSKYIFNGRVLITEFEIVRYLTDKMLFISKINDINLLQAFYLFLDDLNLDEEVYESFKSITAISRVKFLKDYLENN